MDLQFQPDLRLTFLCNAGFLISTGDGLIVLDGLAKDENGLYADTEQSIRQMLRELAGTGLLSGMIISHYHSDHYCREEVMEMLQTANRSGKNNHSRGLPVITTQAVAQDLKTGFSKRSDANRDNIPLPEKKIIRQIYSIPEEEKGFPLVYGSSSLRIYIGNAIHDGKQYANVQNLVVLMEIGGGPDTMRLVFPGDAAPTGELFDRIAQWSDEIDWLAAPFPYVGKSSVRRLMAEKLRIKQIAACHFPLPGKDEQGWIRQTKTLCSQAEDGLPDPVFLLEPGTVLPLLF